MLYIVQNSFSISAEVSLPMYDEHPDLGSFTTEKRCLLSTGDIIETDKSGKVQPVYGEDYTYHIKKTDLDKHIMLGNLILYTGYENILSPMIEKKMALEKELENICDKYFMEEHSYDNLDCLYDKDEVLTDSLYKEMSATIDRYVDAYCMYSRKSSEIMAEIRMINIALKVHMKKANPAA